MPQAALRHTTNNRAQQMTQSSKLADDLAKAWKAHAINRPEFEKRAAELNGRLYQSLKQHPIPETNNLQGWFDRKELLTTELDEKTAVIDEQTSLRLSVIMEAIRVKPCEGLTDLATLANACAAANSELWDGSVEDLDWEQSFVRRLVESVLAVAGSKSVLDGLPLPQEIEQDAFARILSGD
jgi:hypothetical protein